VTETAGVGGSGWSTSAAWVDYDNHGCLDLMVARCVEYDFQDIHCTAHRDPKGPRAYCTPDFFKTVLPLLYHNEGNGKFTEVGRKAGMVHGKGLGVAVADYDRDGWKNNDGKVDVVVTSTNVRPGS
jgi:enediyne biosynthesis protein E4